ncbi:hypothetical protein DDW44_30495 [Streptomyces tirandamycinicus]|uniref:Uncharacterized protein n=1 Tax=Streptomyces tirandamycinicus TaxID=2174846 RepID=A0A2S1T209_9ACTN|nr:hypothetical protein DDW44_30495 [Streptomyces tirandamycinicus]
MLHADALRYDLARRLRGTVEADGTVETRRIRAVVTVIAVRAGLVRVTIRRHDRARPPLTVEMPVEGIDVGAVAAAARAVARRPWQARIAALGPLLHVPFRKDQE